MATTSVSYTRKVAYACVLTTLPACMLKYACVIVCVVASYWFSRSLILSLTAGSLKQHFTTTTHSETHYCTYRRGRNIACRRCKPWLIFLFWSLLTMYMCTNKCTCSVVRSRVALYCCSYFVAETTPVAETAPAQDCASG